MQLLIFPKNLLNKILLGKTDANGNFPWSGMTTKSMKNDSVIIATKNKIVEEEFPPHINGSCYLGIKGPLLDKNDNICGVIGVSIVMLPIARNLNKMY